MSNNALSSPEKIDMSPQAIDRRLREVDQLLALCSSLRRAKLASDQKAQESASASRDPHVESES